MNNSNDDRYAQQAAMMNQQAAYQGLGSYREKDPRVDSAADAVQALKKRAGEIRGHMAKVDGWNSELATIERMLIAAESKS